MTQNPYLWLIPTLPLAGAAINGFLGRRSSKTAVTTIALAFPGLAFALALLDRVRIFFGRCALYIRFGALDPLWKLLCRLRFLS